MSHIILFYYRYNLNGTLYYKILDNYKEFILTLKGKGHNEPDAEVNV